MPDGHSYDCPLIVALLPEPGWSRPRPRVVRSRVLVEDYGERYNCSANAAHETSKPPKLQPMIVPSNLLDDVLREVGEEKNASLGGRIAAWKGYCLAWTFVDLPLRWAVGASIRALALSVIFTYWERLLRADSLLTNDTPNSEPRSATLASIGPCPGNITYHLWPRHHLRLPLYKLK